MPVLGARPLSPCPSIQLGLFAPASPCKKVAEKRRLESRRAPRLDRSDPRRPTRAPLRAHRGSPLSKAGALRPGRSGFSGARCRGRSD